MIKRARRLPKEERNNVFRHSRGLSVRLVKKIGTAWQPGRLVQQVHTIFTFNRDIAVQRELYCSSLCVTCTASCNHIPRLCSLTSQVDGNLPFWILQRPAILRASLCTGRTVGSVHKFMDIFFKNLLAGEAVLERYKYSYKKDISIFTPHAFIFNHMREFFQGSHLGWYQNYFFLFSRYILIKTCFPKKNSTLSSWSDHCLLLLHFPAESRCIEETAFEQLLITNNSGVK